MSKNILGLLKYIGVIPIMALMPYAGIYLLGLILWAGETENIPNFVALIEISFFIMLLAIYFALPIIVTVLAIKNHWSSYLDKFFNQLKIPTIIFLLILLMIKYASTVGSKLVINSLYLWYINYFGLEKIFKTFCVYFYSLYVSVIVFYCIAYVIIIVHNIRKKISK